MNTEIHLGQKNHIGSTYLAFLSTLQ